MKSKNRRQDSGPNETRDESTKGQSDNQAIDVALSRWSVLASQAGNNGISVRSGTARVTHNEPHWKKGLDDGEKTSSVTNVGDESVTVSMSNVSLWGDADKEKLLGVSADNGSVIIPSVVLSQEDICVE